MSDVMAGIRVLEVAEHTFVPAASAILADWGADVIKVEHVERGDAMRGLASTGVLNFGSGINVILEHSNRGKRSMGLDLSTPEGRDILYRLLPSCDVFLTNKVPSVRRRLQIDVDDVKAHNPSIVYVRGTAYGSRGPDADKGGYDSTGYWARGTSASALQPAGADYLPSPTPAYGDSIGAMTIAGGIAAALLHRERTGEADVVDVSLLGTGVWAMSAAIALSQQMGVPWHSPQSRGSMGRNPLTGSFQTSDGRWISLTMLQAFKYWPGFCRAVGHEEWITDERFCSHEALSENAAAASKLIAAELASATLDEWKERLADFNGQWAPVLDTLDIVDDPQVQANGYVLDAHSADGTAFKLTTTPVQFNDEPSRPGRSPDFNEHGDAILTDELGLDWDTVVELKVNGIVA